MTPLIARPERMKTVYALCLCVALFSGCSQRYGIKVVNRSTNEIVMLKISWPGGEVNVLEGLASASASRNGMYGGPSADVTVYPHVRTPTKEVLISYLLCHPPHGFVTNSVRAVIPKDVSEAVRQTQGNFMFVINANGTITSTVSD